MDVSIFEPMVRSFSRKVIPQDRDDLRQNLWIKIMKIYPRICGMPVEDALRFVRTSLRRYLIDQSRKQKLDWVSLEGMIEEQTLYDEMKSLAKELVSEPVQDQVFDSKAIVAEISAWASTQKPERKQFVLGVLDAAICGVDRVKPYVIAKTQGLSGGAAWLITKELGNHLRRQGYYQ